MAKCSHLSVALFGRHNLFQSVLALYHNMTSCTAGGAVHIPSESPEIIQVAALLTNYYHTISQRLNFTF